MTKDVRENNRRSAWRRVLEPFQVFLIDAGLIGLGIVMVEFLVIAFSGRRSPTGFLLPAEETGCPTWL